MNIYELPVINYPAVIITWPKEDIEATDIKKSNLLNIDGGFVSVRARIEDPDPGIHQEDGPQ